MNRDELLATERRFFDEVFGTRPPLVETDGHVWPYDLAELPEDRDWNAWAEEAATLTGPTVWRGYELAITEHERRLALVEYGKKLVKVARADRSLDGLLATREALPDRLAQQHADTASRNRGYAAMRSLAALGPAKMRRAADLSVRCPEGCYLAGYYRKPASLEGSLETLLLITVDGQDRMDAGWILAAPTLIDESRSLQIACPHGRGRLTTSDQPAFPIGSRRGAIVTDLTGASWKTKPSLR